MPKNLKQKASVKNKKKPSTSSRKVNATRKKLHARVQSNDKPVSKSRNEAEVDTSAARAESAVSTLESTSVDMEQNDEISLNDFADVCEERASIISIVKALEGQVETAFKLKEVLDEELSAVRNKLSEELDTRAHLEAQVKLLEVRAALVEQLREDISFAEDERNKFADMLARIEPQLETVTAERDSLAEQMAAAEAHAKQCESEKMALEAQVMNLKDKITDGDRLRRELEETTETNRDLREQLEGLTRHLETSEAAKDTLERDLLAANQTERNLREEVESFREKTINADSRTADLRIQLEDQQSVNRRLMEDKTRLESELKMMTVHYEAYKNEIGAFRNALRDIRSEATLTSGRVRQRYFKLQEKK